MNKYVPINLVPINLESNNLKCILVNIKVSQATISSMNHVNNTTKLGRINFKFASQQNNVRQGPCAIG